MKLRIPWVALVAASLALAACSGDSDTVADAASTPAADASGTLRVWLMESSQTQSVIDEVNATFRKKHPNVDVEVELQQWPGIQDKLTTALGAESPPDVVEVGNSLTATYADEGLLADLSGYAGDLKIADMLPGLIPAGELNGVRYGVPYYGGVSVVVYNKAHFAAGGVQVPRTLVELETAASALQKAHADNDRYSAFYFPGEYWKGAVPFVWNAGGEIAVKDGQKWTGTLNSAESVKGLTQLKGLVEKYSKAPVQGDENKNFDAFTTGDVGMMIDSWWVPGALNTGKLKGDIGAFALPGSARGTTSPVYFGGSDLAVAERSAQQGLAVQWIETLTGLEAQTLLAGESGNIPNQEGAFVGHDGDAFLHVADQASTNSRFTPVNPNWPLVESSAVLDDMLVKIFSNSATVEEAATVASEQITTILND